MSGRNNLLLMSVLQRKRCYTVQQYFSKQKKKINGSPRDCERTDRSLQVKQPPRDLQQSQTNKRLKKSFFSFFV